MADAILRAGSERLVIENTARVSQSKHFARAEGLRERPASYAAKRRIATKRLRPTESSCPMSGSLTVLDLRCLTTLEGRILGHGRRTPDVATVIASSIALGFLGRALAFERRRCRTTRLPKRAICCILSK